MTAQHTTLRLNPDLLEAGKIRGRLLRYKSFARYVSNCLRQDIASERPHTIIALEGLPLAQQDHFDANLLKKMRRKVRRR